MAVLPQHQMDTTPRQLLAVESPAARAAIVALLLFVGIFVIYLVTQSETVFSTQISLILGYVIGIPILLSNNYHRSILTMFAFASVAGLLKYKTGFNPIIHVTVDIMMGVICLGWFIRRFFVPPVQKTPTPLAILIFIFIFICTIQIFHPNGYSYFASVGALKMHIFMIPLYFFGYHYLTSIRQFRQWILTFAIIGIVMGLVSVYQFQMGPDAIKEDMPEYGYMIDQNTWQDETGRSYFRPMSTTANPGGASTWMQCLIPLMVAVCFTRTFSIGSRIVLGLVLVFLIVTLSISLIRQMFMVTCGRVGLIFMLQFFHKRLKQHLMGLTVVFVLLISGINVATQVAGSSGSAIRGLIALLSDPFNLYRENRGSSMYVAYQMAQMYPLGIGLGRTGPAASKFRAEIQTYWEKFGTATFNPSENYFQVLISETGLPGTITMLILTITILWRGYKSYLRLENNDLKWVAVASLSVLVSIFVVFFGGPALVTAPLNMFFWFLAGALFKLPILDQELRQQELKEASG